MKELNWCEIPLFHDMGECSVEMQELFDRMSLKAGEVLIEEGEMGDDMYILVSGTVRITKSMVLKGMKLPLLESGDASKVLATVDGETYPIFGEVALVDRDIRSATITVVEDAEFLVTSREHFFGFLEREPRLGTRLLLELSRRMAATVRRSNSEMIKLSTALALALSRTK